MSEALEPGERGSTSVGPANSADGNVPSGPAQPSSETVSRNPTFLVQDAEGQVESSLTHQVTSSSSILAIHLEPPPVVQRPPKVEYKGFSSTALSWFAWFRNEQADIPNCARSISLSYSHQAKFQLFGFTISKDVSYRTSEGGVDAAIIHIRLGWGKSEANWTVDRLPMMTRKLGKYSQREPEETTETKQPSPSEFASSSTTDVEGQGELSRRKPLHKAPHYAHPWLHDYYYVVVGLMLEGAKTNEKLRRVMDMDGLFHAIRQGHGQLRGPLRRALSMKELCGFGIYECVSAKGYHKEVELDAATEKVLAELWRNYNTHKLDYEGRWLMWIHQNFNNSSKNPAEGRLTLQLKLRWSIFKLVFWGMVPVLLSLAIGFWYMYKDHGEVDDVAVAEAAWVIATYIITTSALLFALLAVITGLGNI